MSERNERHLEKRTGTERAAILLLTLGEQEAAQVLKHMGAKEVQRVGAAMAHLEHVSRDEARAVLTDFSSGVESQTSLAVGVDEFLRKVLVNALGEDKANNVIERISINRSSRGLEALKWMDARAVAELVRLEHPQIIAIILAYLDPDQSADILQQLPGGLRADILMRVASLDGVQPTALSELDDVMEKQFAGKSAGKTSVLGGAKAAADIVNFLDPSQESAIMEQIAATDQAIGARIQDLIFVFGNLIDLDDRSMQELLRQVPSDKLLIALKGTDEELKQKVFKNMSQRAAEMLRDDLEARGPVRLSEVEAAQKEILASARKLAEAGTIALKGKGEEYV
ncbi:MAG: flagellar motor switch protein FliG [Steroidobacteraceae bacterium]